MTAIKTPTARGEGHLISKFSALIVPIARIIGKLTGKPITRQAASWLECPACARTFPDYDRAASAHMLDIAARLADLVFENDALRAENMRLKGGATW